MNQRLLKALMHLFALIGVGKPYRRKIVEAFLYEQLNKEQAREYLKIYDDYLELYKQRHIKSGKNKIIAVSSVKLLKISSLINKDLTLSQKFIVLIKLLEFIKTDEEINEQEYEFVEIIAESFYIDPEEFKSLSEFVLYDKKDDFYNPSKILVINSKRNDPRVNKGIKHLYVPHLWGEIYLYNIEQFNLFLFLFKFYDEKELYLNQQLLYPGKIYVFPVGSSIRNSRINPIYHSDIISAYTFDKIKSKVVFEADRVEFRFKDGKIGIHELSFTERSGRLVGIMGASGSGKTTLLNVLSGIFTPQSGHVLINGIDLHKNIDKLKGLIGYVSQDDLLIEELTVFENLYFNAKLCFENYSNFKIIKIVLSLLKELGLYEIKDMKVGSVLNRKISGGQRKRLNIALELIRQPPILFLDEPTSGLSSRDSENIMDLLKNLTLKGKLVFVVIHQPSSDIFKMFDRMLILDQGGYLIYNGAPIEAIIYFKSEIRAADWTDSQCPVCGTVKPEQIFNIVEAKVLDEYGNPTQTRKISPQEWYERFKKYQETHKKRKRSYLVRKLPEIPFKVPSRFKQFKIFAARDILSKLSNLQYILINLLEAPILSAILTFIIKYWDIKNSSHYIFYYNENIPVYLFMSVIVAIFIGIMVSAQEIIKDRKIRKREMFLNLSWFSYLSAKMFILFIISAYQSLAFVIVGNSILAIKDMFFSYWIILFSVWFSANLLGLNISDGLKTSISIYITIPFLIIPQIILSGVLVNFQKLNPKISSLDHIPWYGELMIAKWAYEALAVKQFIYNKYNKDLYPYDKKIKQMDYITQWWQPEIIKYIDFYLKNHNKPNKQQQIKKALTIIRNELTRHQWTNYVKMDFNPMHITIDKITPELALKIKHYLINLKNVCNNIRNDISAQKDNKIIALKEAYGRNKYEQIMLSYHNEKLEDFVCDKQNKRKIVEYHNKLLRFYYPIYYDPEHYFFTAHFYAPTKPFFGYKVDTFIFNTIFIWLQTLILFILLYYRVLHNLFSFTEFLNKKIKYKKEFKPKTKKNNFRHQIFKILNSFLK